MNTLDKPASILGEETIRESADRSFGKLTNHALGRAYWRRRQAAARAGDLVAVEYWEQHAMKNMSHADKRANGMK